MLTTTVSDDDDAVETDLVEDVSAIGVWVCYYLSLLSWDFTNVGQSRFRRLTRAFYNYEYVVF